MKQFAKEHGLKLRTLQRHRRIFHADALIPGEKLLERIERGELTAHGAERVIRTYIEIALEDERHPIIYLPDRSA
jgi:hypothetical protein